MVVYGVTLKEPLVGTPDADRLLVVVRDETPYFITVENVKTTEAEPLTMPWKA